MTSSHNGDGGGCQPRHSLVTLKLSSTAQPRLPVRAQALNLYQPDPFSRQLQKGFETIPAIILTTNLQKHHMEIDQRQLIGLAKPLELDEFLFTIEQALCTCQESN